MKKVLYTFILLMFLLLPAQSGEINGKNFVDSLAIRHLLSSQVHYANTMNMRKFISTYDSSYVNSDGFDIEMYEKLVNDVWNEHDKIKYSIKVKDLKIENDSAEVSLTEYSTARIYTESEFLPSKIAKQLSGELKSTANSIYYLKKCNGKWKVVSDKVLDETTSMLYGVAKNLDIKLEVPETIEPDTEYTASLEFTPPEETIAIASLSCDKVKYPQDKLEEVFRTFPEENILERLFTSNSENLNEYIVASIALTRPSVCDLRIKLDLVGYGYSMKRVNVIKADKEKISESTNETNE